MGWTMHEVLKKKESRVTLLKILELTKRDLGSICSHATDLCIILHANPTVSSERKGEDTHSNSIGRLYGVMLRARNLQLQ